MCKDAESFRIHFHTLLTYSSKSLPKHITLGIKQNPEERTSLALTYFFPGCVPPQGLPAEEVLSPFFLSSLGVFPAPWRRGALAGVTLLQRQRWVRLGLRAVLSRAEQTQCSSGRGGGDLPAARPPDLA